MITIASITNAQGKIEPERPLTEEESATVISSWFLDGDYRHYQVGEEGIVAAREQAISLVLADIRSAGNAQWSSNIALLASLQQQYGDQYLEQYILTQHPNSGIFE